MAQVINLMSKATGVVAAANHATATPTPADGTYPGITPYFQGETITMRSKITVSQLTQLAINDILVAGAIPPNCELVDAMIITDAIDSGSTLTLTLAQLLQDFTDIVIGTNIITASTVGQAGGIARATVQGGLRNTLNTGSDPTGDTTVNPSGNTWLGLKVAAAVTGLNATTTNELDVQWSYRAAYSE